MELAHNVISALYKELHRSNLKMVISIKGGELYKRKNGPMLLRGGQWKETIMGREDIGKTRCWENRVRGREDDKKRRLTARSDLRL